MNFREQVAERIADRRLVSSDPRVERARAYLRAVEDMVAMEVEAGIVAPPLRLVGLKATGQATKTWRARCLHWLARKLNHAHYKLLGVL